MIQGKKKVCVPYKLVSAEKETQMVDPTAQWFCIYCPPHQKQKRSLKQRPYQHDYPGEEKNPHLDVRFLLKIHVANRINDFFFWTS